MLRALLIAFLCGALFAVPLALWAGYQLWHAPAVAAIEPAAAGYRQADAVGSQVLPRTPVAELPTAPHAIPKGATEVRRIQATVQPHAQPPADDGICTPCGPVRLDLSLAQQDDGVRAIVSSPDGQVTGGHDLALPGFARSAPRHVLIGTWAARDTWSVFALRRQPIFGLPTLAGAGVMQWPGEPAMPALALGAEF